MNKTRLKGGSLSGTYLCTGDGAPFVRKEVSLVHNREYGFQRWYSQLKRMQRYWVLFPGHFPRLLTYGREGEMAYFDMEYIAEAVTVQEFLLATTDEAMIDTMFGALFELVGKMYQTRIASTVAPIELYIYEEIEQKMLACRDNKRFVEIASHPTLFFNGREVQGLAHVVPAFKELARRCYHSTNETFSHGNLTLENILYQPATNTITLIDPYEENVIDSALADYSQVLQSCNSRYEIYNASTPQIHGNRIDLELPSYPGLDYFRDKFWAYLRAGHSADDLTVIRLLEVSQFARMLPFKLEIDEDKMVFFYALGSYLFDQLRGDAR
ncbi:MAG: hypothetical protein ABI867_19020 [Kofleriaceae bacterium]